MKTIGIYIENERLDLFNDENIVLNSSVQNINDISKVFTDYSQSFTVPATQNNNRIFKHYYNHNVSNQFDARLKKDARIEISSLPFREGKIRLEGATIISGKPESYNITFFGNLVSLTDLFKEDTLQNLPLSGYNHDYDAGTIRKAFDTEKYSNGISNTGLFFGALTYVPISPKRQFIYSSDPANVLDNEKELNIANKPIRITDLTMGIRVTTLFEAIESKYNITFSDDFLSVLSLNTFYLTGGNTKDGIHLSAGDGGIDLGAEITQIVDTTNSGQEGVTWQVHSLNVTPKSGYENVSYTIIIKDITNNTVSEKVITKGAGNHGLRLDADDTPYLPYTRTLQFFLNASEPFEFVGEIFKSEGRYYDRGNGVEYESSIGQLVKTVTPQNLLVSVDVALSMPKLKVKDFVSGIINMFNLVVIPINDNEYYIDTLNTWYTNGNTYDITQYVSIEKIPISSTERLNEISFTYEEPNTILALNHHNTTNKYFGDLSYEVLGNDGEKIDGEEFKIELPFEQIIYERLYDTFNNELTNFQYGLATDEEGEKTDHEPFLYYIKRAYISDTPILIDAGNNTTKIVTECNTAHHVDNNTGQSITFGAEQDSYTGGVVTKSLYKTYYEDYITDIFSAKRRVFKYTTKLPEFLLTKINLNDKLVIDGTRYLINNMEINLTTNITELELLNDIY